MHPCTVLLYCGNVEEDVELAGLANMLGVVLADVSITGETLLNDFIIALFVVILMALLLRTPWYRGPG